MISWVADHRKHHAFSDRPGDPHSPHVDHGVGLRGALRGLLHAHVGWLFRHDQRGSRDALRARPARRPRDRASSTGRSSSGRSAASRSRSRSAGDRREPRAGAHRRCCGAAACGSSSCTTSPTASTRSATSSGAAGSRPRTSRATCSGSSLLSFGESWHNNHHAFPTSARHGLGRWELDPSALVIRGAGGLRAGVGRGPREPASASARPRCRGRARAADVPTGAAARPAAAAPALAVRSPRGHGHHRPDAAADRRRARRRVLPGLGGDRPRARARQPRRWSTGAAPDRTTKADAEVKSIIDRLAAEVQSLSAQVRARRGSDQVSADALEELARRVTVSRRSSKGCRMRSTARTSCTTGGSPI